MQTTTFNIFFAPLAQHLNFGSSDIAVDLARLFTHLTSLFYIYQIKPRCRFLSGAGYLFKLPPLLPPFAVLKSRPNPIFLPLPYVKMSRLYFTATMKHSSLGIDLPVFSFETADHTGGGYHLQGLHPSSIAALGGKGPELKKQERFDVKFNVNAKRTSLSLIVNTKKHIPHLEWSSESGTGEEVNEMVETRRRC